MGFYNNSTEVANTNEVSSYEQHLSGTRRSSHQAGGECLFWAVGTAHRIVADALSIRPCQLIGSNNESQCFVIDVLHQ